MVGRGGYQLVFVTPTGLREREKMGFKAGDRVRLTGSKWDHSGGVNRGRVVTIQDTDKPNYVIFEGSPDWVKLDPGWEVELISGNSEEAIANRAREMEAVFEHDTPLQDWEKELLLTPFEQSVHRVTGKIADLLIAKNKQYANSALDPIRVFSKADRTEQLRVRADDKLSRIRNGDVSEDAVMDLCGYLILMKIAEESE